MKRILSIGRDPNNDIIIYDLTDTVSRSHATLRVDGNKLFITDHSTNGTYLNGVRLQSNTEYRVTKKDEVRFADAAYLEWNALPVKHSLSLWVIIPSIVSLLLILAFIYYSHQMNQKTSANEMEIQSTEEAGPASEKIDSTEKQVTVSDVEKKSDEAKAPKTTSKKNKKDNRTGVINNSKNKAEEPSSVDAL